MDFVRLKSKDIVQLARQALISGAPDATKTVRDVARSLREDNPDVAMTLSKLLRSGLTRSTSPAVETPLDLDSRMPLIRVDNVAGPDRELILPQVTSEAIDQLIRERCHPDLLIEAGLAPSKSALFVGPPGVGKTTAARKVANGVGLPLLILDLSSVISSYLGKTGSNIRRVFDYARETPSVLLLDEFDAIAKSRGDMAEIGELKRLVTVLLQEMDDWPEGSLLLAATNHEESLDPAVWRRFDSVVRFELPQHEDIKAFLATEPMAGGLSSEILELLSLTYVGTSLSRLSTDLERARRRAALDGSLPDEAAFNLVNDNAMNLDIEQKKALAASLAKSGIFSQRQIANTLGISRDTIRKFLRGSAQ